MNVKELWNSQADHQNQWDSLGEDEKLAFAIAHEREECAKIIDKRLSNWASLAGKDKAYKWLEKLADAIRARSKA
jgi:hypothetical protein